jgi:hypothetical protein
MDGTPTEYYTPHDFTDLVKIHTFSVPSTWKGTRPGPNSYTFKEWADGTKSTTITVSAEMLYVANYYPPELEAPVFSPPGGTYSSPQSVIITCSTYVNDVSIRYTTDGSEPKEYSAVYLSPIEVSSTTTIKARGYHVDWMPSDIATVAYTINNPPSKVATPTFNPLGGTYSSSQSVTLSCPTSGATIRYTTDGSEPSASSTPYSGPIMVSNTMTF